MIVKQSRTYKAINRITVNIFDGRFRDVNLTHDLKSGWSWAGAPWSCCVVTLWNLILVLNHHFELIRL
jgi:hypothetical protein